MVDLDSTEFLIFKFLQSDKKVSERDVLVISHLNDSFYKTYENYIFTMYR